MTHAVGSESFVALFRAIPTCAMIALPDGRPVYGNMAAIENFGPIEAIRHVADIFAPPFDAVVRDAFVNVGQRLMTSRTVGGRTRIYSGYTLALDDCGDARVAILLHETTDQMRARREAEALARVAAATAFAGTLESTMDALAEAVVSAAGSDACSVVIFEESPMRMRLIGSSGLPENYGREFDAIWKNAAPVPNAQEALEGFSRGGAVMRGVRQAMLADPLYATLHPHLRKATWDSMASTPLRSRGRLLGALTCYYAAGREVADDDSAFLQAVADQAAVAIENARLFLEVQQKAVLEERQRLARELHDSVSQALYAIGLGARTALVQLDRDPPKARDPMEYVLSLAEGGLAEMRALIFELRPEDLDRDGLVAALRRHIAALRARHGLIVHDVMCDEPALDPAVRLALYRIAQEAVHNVTRHAQAHNVHIVLACDDESACIEIRDDGVGFDADGHFPGHLGLRSMRERAERLGGEFSLDSVAGSGTRIVARFPHRRE